MKRTVTHQIDQVEFELQEEHDFAWLHQLGTVFCVFDQQDSGNIAFGVERDGRRKFVKYAGARTTESHVAPQDAIQLLRQAMPLYENLRHPVLIELEEHFATADGYVAIFDWFSGECLHSHWAFTPHEKYNHPNSPFYRYKQLPVELRLRSIDQLFAFHVEVARRGYVAVDFYDGSILYDFENNATRICDIDYYRKTPTTNDQGDLWGSRRFKSPEEYQLGAPLDEKTNVFTMGSIAFALLGGELDHSYERWEAGKDLYEIALRATEPDREKRFASLRDLYEAWKKAAAQMC